jgi:hypothetical protein
MDDLRKQLCTHVSPRISHMFDVLIIVHTTNIEMFMAKNLPLKKNLTFGGTLVLI